MENCLKSLADQTIDCEIIVCSGPKTDMRKAGEYADRILGPFNTIRDARIAGILNARTDFIISCDSDTIYDRQYCEYAYYDLQRLPSVKAGLVFPKDIDRLEGLDGWVALIESFLTNAIPYEFTLAFRKSEFIKRGLHLRPTRWKRDDIGIDIATYMPPIPDPRMVCWSRLPTANAVRLAKYGPSLLLCGIPIAGVAGVIGLSELAKLAKFFNLNKESKIEK